jgi:sulfur-oxidizing protein SoxB
MLSRRDFLQLAAATAAVVGPGGWSRSFAQQRLTQDELLAFAPLGNVTLVHVTDIHAQLVPIHFREPSDKLGGGEAKDAPSHLVGRALLDLYGVTPGSALAHALADVDFESLARSYGRVGGLDRIATIVGAIRAERGANMLLLDGGDTWQNSYTSLVTKGQDMVDCMARLKPDAMTGHWEFTLGEARVKELVGQLGFPFLCQNVRDNEWQEPVFPAAATFERGGVKIAVIGQALPYTPIANPRWMIPNWSFGIRERELRAEVAKARAEGAGLVVLLSHNGFDVDRKLAQRVEGIDVILTGHTHDALPAPVIVGKTLLIASGSHGKFVSRLDLDVRDGAVKAYRYKLIPVFADAVAPDTAMAAEIEKQRAPHQAMLREVVGRAGGLLYRRGTFHGTFDDVICDALLAERDAEIALSPGFRWGTTLLPGQNITMRDLLAETAITYPDVYVQNMTGADLKSVLEDVCDNLFNPDPYLQQGGDMVRVGGMNYACAPAEKTGARISDMTLDDGTPIEAGKTYRVAGWASVNLEQNGTPVWEVVAKHLRAAGIAKLTRLNKVKLKGITDNPGYVP